MNKQDKKISGFSRLEKKVFYLFSVFIFLAAEVSAQMPKVTVPPSTSPAVQPEEDFTWWYVSLLILVLGLLGAIFWAIKSRKEAKTSQTEAGKKRQTQSDNEAWDMNSVDADKEMEWYRRHKKVVGKNPSRKGKIKPLPNGLPQTSNIFNRQTESQLPVARLTEKEFKKKLEKLQFTQLPIASFQKLELARPFAPLTISNDLALMSAIEQTHDEFEEDEEVRDLAVRILMRFKTRNSIEALSQIALYDLSSNLRSKAVSILTDFDHESVFDTILLACADPTREVRAAAARGLFRLSFDRADAWSRIAETSDEFRMKQAARAAVEADLVSRSLDRLVHDDKKVAYEAVALLALMIKADETQLIFEAIENHPDKNVKLAILKVLEIVKYEQTLSNLYELLEKPTIPAEIKEKIDLVIQSFELVPA